MQRVFLEIVFFYSARTIFIQSTWNHNGICKAKLSTEVRNIFTIYWKFFELRGIFHDFFTRNFFLNGVVFSKINIFKYGYVFLLIFIYRKKEICFLVPV